ncbi:hypothetical protein ACTXT7_017527, partial [Hymenolepis weldensis]
MENSESQNEREVEVAPEVEQEITKSMDDEELKNETTVIKDEEKPTEDEKEGLNGTEEEKKDIAMEMTKEE